MGGRLRDAPRTIPLMTLSATLRDRRVLITSAILVVLNLLTIIGFGSARYSGGIAWEAHLGGYVIGIFTYGLFDNVQQSQERWQPNEY